MEHKTFLSMGESVDETLRQVTGLASVTGNLDFGNDIIHAGAFLKTVQERTPNVQHLWMHNASLPPIATITNLREVGYSDLPPAVKENYPHATGGLEVSRKYLPTDRGNEVYEGIKAGAIKEMSIGFDLVKWDFEETEIDSMDVLVRNIREVRLWDTSDVNWGMNDATVAVKSLPYRDTGIEKDREKEWCEPTLADFTDEKDFTKLSDAEKSRIAAHFAWSVNSPPQSFDDLKLAHHAPAKNGVGPVVFNGLALAMGQLLDVGKSHVEEHKNGHSHLAKHYEQFSEKPPAFKTVQLLWQVDNALKWFDPNGDHEMKGEFVYPDLLFEKFTELYDMLRAEPRNQNALTQAKVQRELAIRKRVFALSNL